MDERDAVREFLASRRARLTPTDVGLPEHTGRRRVAGLRRDEVAAQWAFIDQLRGELQARAIRPLAYPAGSYGPTEATALAFRFGGTWSEALTLAG